MGWLEQWVGKDMSENDHPDAPKTVGYYSLFQLDPKSLSLPSQKFSLLADGRFSSFNRGIDFLYQEFTTLSRLTCWLNLNRRQCTLAALCAEYYGAHLVTGIAVIELHGVAGIW
jgi:hypothetical protein